MVILLNGLHSLNKLSGHTKRLVRLCSSKPMLGVGVVIFVSMAMVTLAASNFITQVSANCAYGGECTADRHTATGDANNPKSWKNTGTVDTRDKCLPHKQTCP